VCVCVCVLRICYMNASQQEQPFKTKNSWEKKPWTFESSQSDVIRPNYMEISSDWPTQELTYFTCDHMKCDKVKYIMHLRAVLEGWKSERVASRIS